MPLCLAIWVKEHAVFYPICAAFASPNQVVAMPSRELGDFLVAHWAHSVLVLPKVQELSFSGEVLLCFHVKTFFKVGFPSRVEWVGSPLNGRVPLDFHLGGSPEVNNLRVSFLVPDFSCKHPIVRTLGCEVFLPYPGCAFLWVSSPGPPPEFFKDCTIHGVKGFAAGSKSMVICPSSYYWVQFYEDLSGRTVLVFFDETSDLFHECFPILFGGSG